MTPDPTVTAVSDEALVSLREMAGTVAVKGPLLIQLIDEIEASRARSALADVGEKCEANNWPMCDADADRMERAAATIEALNAECDALRKRLDEMTGITTYGVDGIANGQEQPRPAAEAVCTHCMNTPEERAHPEHYNVRPCRYCSPAAHTAQDERDALQAGVMCLEAEALAHRHPTFSKGATKGDIRDGYRDGNKASEDKLRHANVLRRLAEQGSAKP